MRSLEIGAHPLQPWLFWSQTASSGLRFQWKRKRLIMLLHRCQDQIRKRTCESLTDHGRCIITVFYYSAEWIADESLPWQRGFHGGRRKTLNGYLLGRNKQIKEQGLKERQDWPSTNRLPFHSSKGFIISWSVKASFKILSFHLY